MEYEFLMLLKWIDVAEMDNGSFNNSEMDDKWFNAIQGVVRFIKAHITP